MAFELWEPFREAVSLRDAMNSLLQESYVRPGGGHGQSTAVALPVDVAENDNEFVVKASLPGMKPENVQITIQGDALSIRAEAKTEEEQKGDRWHLRERKSRFQRSLSLGTPVDSEKAIADFEHGVLTLETAQSRSVKAASDQDRRTRSGAGWPRERIEVMVDPGRAEATRGKIEILGCFPLAVKAGSRRTATIPESLGFRSVLPAARHHGALRSLDGFVSGVSVIIEINLCGHNTLQMSICGTRVVTVSIKGHDCWIDKRGLL